jgi:large subunit ribosomal protein L31
MKKMTVQPTLYVATVRCSSCGATFETRSTRERLNVDVCSRCHPAYTGVERAAVTGGRIENFNRRRALAQA